MAIDQTALVEALRRGRGDRRSTTTATETDLDDSNQMKFLGIAISIMERLEKNKEDMHARRDLGALRAQVAAQKAYLSYQSATAETSAKNAREVLKAETERWKALISVRGRFLEKYNATYDKVVTQGKLNIKKAGETGGNPIIAAFSAFNEMGLGKGGAKSPIDKYDPRFPSAFRQLAEAVNEQVGGGGVKGAGKNSIFVFNDDGTLEWDTTKERLINAGIQGKQKLATIGEFAEAYVTQVPRLNAYLEEKESQIKFHDEAMQAAAAELNKNTAEGDAAAATHIEAAKSAAHVYQKAWEVENGIGDIESAQEEVNLALSHSQAYQAALDMVAKLTGEEKEEKILGRSKAIADPEWLAWAADHGFDAIGRVPMKEDGTPDYARYVAGGDDVAALELWEKQSLRTPGNYGLKGIRTGEIVNVELKDGTQFTGHRLRRHAADPYGVIRVVSADGVQLVTPEETDRVVILKSPAPNPSRLDVRSRRIHRKGVESGEYSRALLGAMESGDIEQHVDFARTEEGAYVTRDGEYVPQREVTDALDAAFRERTYSVVDDPDSRGFLLSPEGDVFQIGEDQDGLFLVPVKDEAKVQELLASVPDDPAERAGIGVEQEDGSIRLLTSEDIVDGRLPEATWSEEPGEEGLFDAAQLALKASITPDTLGYQVTDESPGILTGVDTEETDIGGIRYATIDTDPGELEDIEAQTDAFEAAQVAEQEEVFVDKEDLPEIVVGGPGDEYAPVAALPRVTGDQDQPPIEEPPEEEEEEVVAEEEVEDKPKKKVDSTVATQRPPPSAGDVPTDIPMDTRTVRQKEEELEAVRLDVSNRLKHLYDDPDASDAAWAELQAKLDEVRGPSGTPYRTKPIQVEADDDVTADVDVDLDSSFTLTPDRTRRKRLNELSQLYGELNTMRAEQAQADAGEPVSPPDEAARERKRQEYSDKESQIAGLDEAARGRSPVHTQPADDMNVGMKGLGQIETILAKMGAKRQLKKAQKAVEGLDPAADDAKVADSNVPGQGGLPKPPKTDEETGENKRREDIAPPGPRASY